MSLNTSKRRPCTAALQTVPNASSRAPHASLDACVELLVVLTISLQCVEPLLFWRSVGLTPPLYALYLQGEVKDPDEDEGSDAEEEEDENDDED